MKTALTIAGSDSSCGAGIQADIKAMTANGVYATCAVTAITAQNTKGVFAVQETDANILEMQIEAVANDIFPDAVKTGMIPNEEQVGIISKSIKKFSFKNVIVDPVMISTSGTRLISIQAIKKMQEEVFPIATLITPNIPEAEFMLASKIDSETKMQEAAEKLAKTFGCAVLLKGGHKTGGADDFLFASNSHFRWFRGERIRLNEKSGGNETFGVHGTGCALSSAIAANMAKGLPLDESIARAKEYMAAAIKSAVKIGRGDALMIHAQN